MSCIYSDIVIVGCGVAGLFTALNLPCDTKITILSKTKKEESDSYLAQGGICVLRDDNDFDSFFDDTLKAGHYENSPQAVETMIANSRDIVNDLIKFGVVFENNNGEFIYTREGAHSNSRILFNKDMTGKEITSKLLDAVLLADNISLLEDTTMLDIIVEDNSCCGIIAECNNSNFAIFCDYTIWATGGVGGLYQHSTNFNHLTGDSLSIALKHNINIKNIDYVQIHPTTFYSKNSGRRFLISESVRGEGGILLDKNMSRFVNELLPRDILSKTLYQQMLKDNTEFIWLSFENIPKDIILHHFPNIYNQMLIEGYDILTQPIPIVPAQHYYMGGVEVDLVSKTSLDRLYAVGETSCNGVHGANRLASNSLLESLVFAKLSAEDIKCNYKKINNNKFNIDDLNLYNKNKILSDYSKILKPLISAV